MTKGDAGRIKCPACKKNIDRPLGDVPTYAAVVAGVRESTIRCPHCTVELHLWARWIVAVEAERESKVK